MMMTRSTGRRSTMMRAMAGDDDTGHGAGSAERMGAMTTPVMVREVQKGWERCAGRRQDNLYDIPVCSRAHVGGDAACSNEGHPSVPDQELDALPDAPDGNVIILELLGLLRELWDRDLLQRPKRVHAELQELLRHREAARGPLQREAAAASEVPAVGARRRSSREERGGCVLAWTSRSVLWMSPVVALTGMISIFPHMRRRTPIPARSLSCP